MKEGEPGRAEAGPSSARLITSGANAVGQEAFFSCSVYSTVIFHGSE
ncbi:MAG: hypothetical protein NTZ74_14570 [Chloroflexi bacterium]|nr:hypothetical protein [Chloroflexota bacterium]